MTYHRSLKSRQQYISQQCCTLNSFVVTSNLLKCDYQSSCNAVNYGATALTIYHDTEHQKVASLI